MTHRRLPERDQLKRGESMSDRLVRFPGTSWEEIEDLPEPPHRTIQRTIFQLLDEPVPPMAAPVPATTRCPALTNYPCR